MLVLVWYRKGEDIALLGAGFGVSRATAYRYRDEAVPVLAVAAPDLHDVLRRVAEEGWSHVILDGKLFTTDRCAQTTTSVKGTTIDAWYSGKHRTFGGNIQAVLRPDGLPVWTSDALPGNLHDLTCARHHDLPGALRWAASSTCPPSPTPATKAQATAFTPRSSTLPTATAWHRTTRPTTPCCDPYAPSVNVAWRC